MNRLARALPFLREQFNNYRVYKKGYPRRNKYGGEMIDLERKRLFSWIYDSNPKNVLEVGTGDGGGATFYVANALKRLNNNGVLYTCDPVRGPSEEFLSEYKNVKYFKCKSEELIKFVAEEKILLDFIVFDGPEDPNLALKDIKALEQHIRPGTRFSMHDWFCEKRPYDNLMSVKSKLIRPYMENSSKWRLLELLDGNTTESVGLCLYEFV